MADNKSIKFPKQHYVGFQARPSQDEVPLGFMTPEGSDAAAVKRKATVDSWASGGGYYAANKAKDKLPAQVFDNEPLIGFKMGRSVRHGYGWGQGNVKWRIEDPRGFELEISSPNFAQIISFCNIEKGEIQEECIWARLGNENILVPVNSDVYENTIRNTERMSKKASMRDVKIGDHAVMVNGEEGVYYGAMYITSTGHAYTHSNGYHSRTTLKVVQSTGKKRHVFLMQQPGSDGLSSTKFFKALSSPKVAEKFDAEETWTLEESEAKINQMMADGISMSESSTTYATEIGASIKYLEPKAFQGSLETVSLQEAIDWCQANDPNYRAAQGGHQGYYVAERIKGTTVVELQDGTWVIVDVRALLETRARPASGAAQWQANRQYYGNAYQKNLGYDELVCNKIDRDDLLNNFKITVLTEQVPNPNTYYGSSRFTEQPITVNVNVADIPDELTHIKKSAMTDNDVEVKFYV